MVFHEKFLLIFHSHTLAHSMDTMQLNSWSKMIVYFPLQLTNDIIWWLILYHDKIGIVIVFIRYLVFTICLHFTLQFNVMCVCMFNVHLTHSCQINPYKLMHYRINNLADMLHKTVAPPRKKVSFRPMASGTRTFFFAFFTFSQELYQIDQKISCA